MYEVEIMQIFETLDDMERTLDAPSEYFAVMRDDLSNALFAYCESYRDYTPNEILDIYMDDMGRFSLMAPNDPKKTMYEGIASLTKKLKEFYILDLFDKNLNHPVEDEDAYKVLCDRFEKRFVEA